MKKGDRLGKTKAVSEVCHHGSLPGPEEIKRTTSWPKASTWPPAGPRGADNWERGTQTSPLPAAFTSHLEWGWGRRRQYRPRMGWGWGCGSTCSVGLRQAPPRRHQRLSGSAARAGRTRWEAAEGRPRVCCAQNASLPLPRDSPTPV